MQWSPRAGRDGRAGGRRARPRASPSVVVDATGRVLVGAGALLLLAWPPGTSSPGPGWPPARTASTSARWTGRRHLPWPGLRVGVRETRRLGVRSRTLELDTAAGPDDDGVLVVLGRRDLGADPEEVARALRALDPTAVT